MRDARHGYATDTDLAEDNGQRRYLDIHLPFTTSSGAAQRIAKIELLRRRNFGTGTFSLNTSAYKFTPLDIIPITSTYLGFNGKVVEVTGTRLRTEKAEGDAYTMNVEIDVQETDSTIYDWETEEQLSPQGYVQATLPNQTDQEAVFPWSPGYASADAGDALYGAPASFGVQPNYSTDTQGNGAASVKITGYPPSNVLDEEIFAPQLDISATTGSLPAGDYVVAMTAQQTGSTTSSRMSNWELISLSSTGGIKVDINWSSGDHSGDLYLGYWGVYGFVWHKQQSVDYSTTSVTLTNFDKSTPGGSDKLYDHIVVHTSQIVHSGCLAPQVQAVTANTVTMYCPAVTANQWAGYTLSLLAKLDTTVPVPVLNLPVASNTASDSGNLFTVTIGTGADGNTLPDLTTLLQIGDLLVFRFKATFTSTTFSDPNIANGTYVDGATHVEAGHVAVCLTGKNAGDSRSIASVGTDVNGKYTIFTIDSPWAVTPSTGDIVVVVEPTELPAVASPSMRYRTTATAFTVSPTLPNLAGSTWLFRVTAADVDGKESSLITAPARELYISGGFGTRVIGESGSMKKTDSLVCVDATAGDVVFNCLPFIDVMGQSFQVSKLDPSVNTVTVKCADGDSFEDGTTAVVLVAQGDSISFRVHN